MVIFVWMYILLFLIWIISSQLSKKNGRIFACVSSFLVLWLIQALRSTDVGTDLVAYIPSFHKAYSVEFGQIIRLFSMEKGYVLYNEIIGHFITKNDNVFLAITAFIAIAPIAYIIYKYSKTPSLSFIIFASLIIYLFDFSGLRQAIAIGMTTLSFVFIHKKRIIPFILLVLLASTIHISSIIFLIAYPIYNYLKLSAKGYVIIGVISIICLFYLNIIAHELVSIIFEEGKYVGYLDKQSGAYMLFILFVIFFIYTFKNQDKENRHLRGIIFIGVLLQSLGLISTTATRMGYYFFIFFFLSFPDTVMAYKSENVRTFMRLGIAAFMVFFFFYTTGVGTMGVIPYKFFWE